MVDSSTPLRNTMFKMRFRIRSVSEVLIEPLIACSIETILHFRADCGKIYPLENGHAHFFGYTTTFNNIVPVHCDNGYEVVVLLAVTGAELQFAK